MLQDVKILDHIGEKDMANERTVLLDNGNKIHMKRYDPFGHIKINWDKGQMPQKLRGEFTSFDEARKAVSRYLSDLSRTAVGEDDRIKKA